MYESYYGLTGKPFQLNPDPAFFFGSRGHKRAYAYLAVRPPPERGLHRHYRRRRRRQDDDGAQPALAARLPEGRRGPARQHPARRRRHAQGGRDRVRRPGQHDREGDAARAPRGVPRRAGIREQACAARSSTRRRTSRRARSKSSACCRTSSSRIGRCCRASSSGSRSCARCCGAARCSSCGSA